MITKTLFFNLSYWKYQYKININFTYSADLRSLEIMVWSIYLNIKSIFGIIGVAIIGLFSRIIVYLVYSLINLIKYIIHYQYQSLSV